MSDDECARCGHDREDHLGPDQADIDRGITQQVCCATTGTFDEGDGYTHEHMGCDCEAFVEPGTVMSAHAFTILRKLLDADAEGGDGGGYRCLSEGDSSNRAFLTVDVGLVELSVYEHAWLVEQGWPL